MPPPCAWPLYDVIKLPINRWRKHPVEASWFSSTDVSRNAFAVHSFGSISRGRREHDARKFGELLATITRRIRRKFPRKFVLAVNETIGEVRTTLRIDSISIYFLWKDFVPSFSHFIILDNSDAEGIWNNSTILQPRFASVKHTCAVHSIWLF